MFARFRRSWELTKQSAAVLMSDKALLMFPVMSAIATVLVIASFILPVFLAGTMGGMRHPNPLTYLTWFLFYFCNYFVTIFFNCALVGAANKALSGQHASVGDGISLAMQRIGRIVMWALVAATVGIILRTLEERAGKWGRIVIALLGSAWSVLTYFIIPVIVFEDLGVGEGVKRSAALIKQTWGEGISKSITFGALTMLAFIPLVLGTVALAYVQWIVAVVFAVTYIALLATVISAMDGIFKVALYRYAAQGAATQGISPELVQGAFVQKS
jgi:uncharacterized protein DUF6159